MPDTTHHYGPDPAHGGDTEHRGDRETCPGPSCGPTATGLPEIPEAAVTAALTSLDLGAGYEWETRQMLTAAAPHLRAAVLDEVDAAFPNGTIGITAWLARHGLGFGAGSAAVLAAIRQDLRALAGPTEESP